MMKIIDYIKLAFRSRQEKRRAILNTLWFSSELSGKEIGDRAHLGAGTLYVHLYAMENEGILQSRWDENDEPQWDDVPRRRLYRLSSPCLPPQTA